MRSNEQMVSEVRYLYGLEDKRVLSAMEKVPRDRFVPKKYKLETYNDTALPIGYDQTISQPYTVAIMTHLLGLKGKEKVLEIGTGSGYQAAVLSLLAKKVYTIEIIEKLAKKAVKRLKRLGYDNVYLKVGSGERGWKSKAPFDAILITAGIDKVPKTIFKQLKTRGVLVAPVGEGNYQTMTRFRKKKDGSLHEEKFSTYVFVPFIREKQLVIKETNDTII